jgi:tetratricopeptide (TPR) repeat protein
VPASSSLRLRLFSFTFGAALAASSVGCHPSPPVAPSWDGRAGAPVSDKDLPLAAAHYAFSRSGTPGRTELARPLADRLLIRSRALFAVGRERAGLAAVRLAAMIMRTNKAAPETLSNDAVAAFEHAVTGPAARGEEGPAIGIYLFWSVARPSDVKPKTHLDAIAKWTGSPADFPPSALVSVAREGVRRSDALAYSPTDGDRGASDKTLLEWMDQVVAFKEGERTPARYADEVYSAVLGYRTAGVRLVAGHLRDGDIAGAVDAISAPQSQGFIPDALRRALLDAGASPSLEGYEQVVASLLPNAKLEGMEDAVSDAVLGTSLAATGDHPQSGPLAEVVARGMFMAGSGDAAPAMLARALLGTKDDPRRPPAKDLGRAISVSAAAIRDYADREDYEAARRTYASTEPLLLAADRIGGVTPSTAMVKTLMGLIEGEAGRASNARTYFDEALAVEPLATAFAGRARIEAKEGNLTAARASIDKALAAKGTDGEPALQGDLLILSGDYARRAGDANGARAAYERALKLLVPMQKTAKGGTATEINARIAAILIRFEGAEAKEDEAATAAESASASDSRALARLAMMRFLRAVRTQNASKGKEAFRRAMALGLSGEDQVRAAVLARAIGKRGGLAEDTEITKVLTTAASKDDSAGRLAKFALGQLDAATLIAKAPSPRRVVSAKFVIAMTAWGNGGVDAARKDLEVVAKADVIGTVDGDLALEALDPSKGAIPGAPKGVTGL